MIERRIRWILGLAALGALCPSAVQGQSAPALSYRAPPECPTREQFGAEVAARLGRVAFSPQASERTPETEERMEVEILAGGEGWLATLSLGSPSMRAFRDADCAALVRTMATAAAVLLDPAGDEAQAATGAPDASVPAGASEVAAPPASPVTPPEDDDDDELRVRVTADRPGLTLHVGRRTTAFGGMVAGTTEFERVCTAPCEARLEPGMHHLAVSQGVGTAVSVDELVPVRGDSRLSLQYEDDSVWRWTGGALMVAGGLALIAAIGWAVGLTEQEEDPVLTAPIALTGIGLAGYVGGLVLVLDGDDAAVRVDGPL